MKDEIVNAFLLSFTDSGILNISVCRPDIWML